ncbi:hypothetical protein DBB36_02620 [Flavobacterium sp. WLB]|uniref:hypothetical protein n=1 Tax=unclassified Flavobacterium TaxID=196869 RepID=UPI0006AB8C4D|nr:MULTISPECIES: hypothetical protein [unclassified Flavobacterium]KOP40130.1 hypothetical protein AKO67_00400 [Flavobacterium sp. VMW]MDR6760989.1 putative Zn-ribbon and HTH transcriptional regulator [Flavobacterium sp. 2755]OWU91485.1 hypothetical protein APR43_08480 [Flavobacterium sp. NLM]PUU71628.1 hypothetical protein DBB36_02620 [Flavobacterium sp. WLB]
MDIQLEKLKVIKILEETNDPLIIKAVGKMLTEMKKDWWDDLSKEQKEDVAQSELEFERGEFTSFEDVMKKYK